MSDHTRAVMTPNESLVDLLRRMRDQELRYQSLKAGSGWIAYTPVLTASVTNPTLGSGSLAEGRYIEVPGHLVIYRFAVEFGTSGVNRGDGQYRISLPVPATSLTPASIYTSMGSGVLFDWSESGHKELCTWQYGISSYLTGVVDDSSIFHNAPFDWAAEDRMSGTVMYQSI